MMGHTTAIMVSNHAKKIVDAHESISAIAGMWNSQYDRANELLELLNKTNSKAAEELWRTMKSTALAAINEKIAGHEEYIKQNIL